jgi:hypothetical protein
LTPIAEIAEVLLKSLTDRLAVAAILVCSGLILLWFALPNSAVGKWSEEHIVLIFIVGFFAFCYLPTRLIVERMQSWETDHEVQRKYEKRLKRLTKREKEILAPYIVGDFRTRRFPDRDPVAKGLADAGILYCPQVTEDVYGNAAYNIQDRVLEYLKANPHIVGTQREKENPGDE